MKPIVLPPLDRPHDPHAAMLPALARAHALQIEQLAEAALAMDSADLAHVDLRWLARELVELTQQAAVIEATARRLADPEHRGRS